MSENNYTTGDVTALIKKAAGNGRATLVLAVLGTLIASASTFMFCLIPIKFDFEKILEPSFWSKWLAMCISTISAFALVTIHKDEKNKLSPWFTEKKALIGELGAQLSSDFDIYLEEINLERRIKWHKAFVNRKIGLLKKKVLKLKLKNKPYSKYDAQIKEWERLLTAEYLEENKYNLKTKSKPLHRCEIVTDTHDRGGEEGKKSTVNYYSTHTIFKVSLSLAMSAAFACILLDNFEVGINAAGIVSILLSMLSIALSVVSGILTANGCYRNVYMPNVLFSIKILRGYYEWQKTKSIWYDK